MNKWRRFVPICISLSGSAQHFLAFCILLLFISMLFIRAFSIFCSIVYVAIIIRFWIFHHNKQWTSGIRRTLLDFIFWSISYGMPLCCSYGVHCVNGIWMKAWDNDRVHRIKIWLQNRRLFPASGFSVIYSFITFVLLVQMVCVRNHQRYTPGRWSTTSPSFSPELLLQTDNKAILLPHPDVT